MPNHRRRRYAIPSDLKPGLAKRMYGSIHFIDILNRNLPSNPGPSPDPDAAARRNPQEIFHCFVNKLAHICDVKQGGDAVTAIAVLQPGGIEYRLSSNNRTHTSFEKVKKYLANDILGALGKTSDEAINSNAQEENLRAAILLKVIAFNRWRIHSYIKTLAEHIGSCISDCDGEATPTAQSRISSDLRTLQSAAERAQAQWPDAAEFARQARGLLQVISARYHHFEGILRREARGGNQLRLNHWAEVDHAVGRLHSYNIAMSILVEARKMWPELFEDFRVTHVPSAPCGENPMRLAEARCTGRDILVILNASDDILHTYSTFSPELVSQINKELKVRIKAQANAADDAADSSDSRSNSVFYTNVHAEVNLADSIFRENQDPEAEAPIRFFNEHSFGRYIGSSKPTCLLCHLYFSEHNMHFQLRPSHHNLYAKWRVPEGTHTHHLEAIANKLKNLLCQTITERVGTRRRYDSRNTPTDPWRGVISSYRSLVGITIGGGSAQEQTGQSSMHGLLERLRDDEESDEGIEEMGDLMSQLSGESRVGSNVGCRGDISESEDSDNGGAAI